jgi:hypothetical protein
LFRLHSFHQTTYESESHGGTSSRFLLRRWASGEQSYARRIFSFF